jgi:ribosomal protein S19
LVLLARCTLADIFTLKVVHGVVVDRGLIRRLRTTSHSGNNNVRTVHRDMAACPRINPNMS